MSDSPQTQGRPPRAVFFDLDNTLFDHRRAAREALAELHRRYAVGADLDEFVRLYFEINQRMWLLLSTGEIDAATLRAQRFVELFALVGMGEPADAVALGREYFDIYLGLSYAFPGAEEALAELEPLVPLGLLTNGFTDAQGIKIDRLGWRKYFKWIAVAETLGVFKPAPEIYERICEMAGLPPEDILYVGDSPVEDVIAGRRAGLRTVWVRHDGPEVATWAAEAEADYEVADAAAVAPLVKRLLARR